MKLSSTALATLIITIPRHGHFVCASADGDHDHERKLLINQADAAKRVNDIVNSAMASVSAGDDVHGVALPLNYVVLSGNPLYDGGVAEQLLTVALRLPGVDRDQHVAVDTGSSSLAFCNKSLIEEAVGITKTDYALCKAYGDLFSCPNYAGPVAGIFVVGQVFQGNISAYFDTIAGKEIASMDDAYFTIMSKEQIYTCDGPLDGIIGVAYSVENVANKIPSPEFDVLNMWEQKCEDNKGSAFGRCNSGDMSEIPLPSPLEQSLKAHVDSGYNSAKAFGLYCDYAATIGSKKDTIVPSLGIYFGGDLALNNTFYNGGTPQVASVIGCGATFTHYLLKLNSIRLNNMTQSGFNQCNGCDRNGNPHCVTDTGGSSIRLPLPQSFCDDLLMKTNVNVLKESGSLLLDLEGVSGSIITLSLPLHWLAEQGALGYVKCSGLSGNFVLGFPIFQYYYLAYNMENNTVTFVDLQLSNETEAFVNGPELGGANETSPGCRLLSTSSVMTIGFLLLASQYIF